MLLRFSSIQNQLPFIVTGDFGCGDGAWTPVMKIDGNKVSQRCQCKSFLSLSSVDKDWPFFSTALI